MKHIKIFENFSSPIQRKQIENAANSILKTFDEMTELEEPIKRKLTEDEKNKLHKYFCNYSWSTNVDNQNRIIFGGGMYHKGKPKGIYYINVDDLQKLP